MSTVTPNDKAASKVIAKACAVVDRRQGVKDAPEDQKKRAIGRVKVATKELDEAVHLYRRAGEAEHG